jgi:hypothetical protein
VTEMELLEQTRLEYEGVTARCPGVLPRVEESIRSYAYSEVTSSLAGFESAVSDLVASQAERRGGEFGEEEERYGAAVREAA